MEKNSPTHDLQEDLKFLSIGTDQTSRSECLAITYGDNVSSPNTSSDTAVCRSETATSANQMAEASDENVLSETVKGTLQRGAQHFTPSALDHAARSGEVALTGEKTLVPKAGSIGPREALSFQGGERDVKSKAVVEFEACQTQVKYSQLKVNTDLNGNSSSWLRNSSIPIPMPWGKDRNYSYGHLKNFSIANKYLHLVGDVDIVADAETIKQLLKIPYNEGGYFISIIVHRFGNSLVIDQFDLHQHKRIPDEKQWQWFLKFVVDQISNGGDKKTPRTHDHSREKLQELNRLSRLLCASAIPMPAPGSDWQQPGDAEGGVGGGRHGGRGAHEDTRVVEEVAPLVECNSMAVAMAAQALSKLPDPLPYPEKEKMVTFARDVVWTIDDSIKMLVGADLPIFGGDTHPCLTLKLRDAEKPINVMTGIDIWLDNMMCNVPEVEMCFQINGVVQKYERIKTQDIPNLEGSQFNPADIINIMQNILIFLKRNATQEGHTYWLHQDNDVVKLWDLTALCPSDQLSHNPFLVPVGSLLYRMARQLRLKYGLQEEASIRTLLERCIVLLKDTDDVEVLSPAYYLLADLYVPDCALRGLWTAEEEERNAQPGARKPSSPTSPQDKADTARGRDRKHKWKPRRNPDLLQGEVGQQPETLSTVSVTSLKMKPKDCFKLNSVPYRCSPITGQQEQRCNMALKFIAKSLRTLARKQTSEMTRPSTKALLLRKAAIVCYKQGLEIMNTVKRFGHALRKVRLAVHCLEAMALLEPSMQKENWELGMLLLRLAGEVRCELLAAGMRSRAELEDHLRNFDELGEDETFVLSSAQHVVLIPESSWSYMVSEDATENLDACLRCYEEALQIWAQRGMVGQADFYATYNRDLKQGLSQALLMMGCNVLAQTEKGLQQCCSGQSNEDMDAARERLLGLLQDAFMVLSSGLKHCQAAEDSVGQANFHARYAQALRMKFDIVYVTRARGIQHPPPPTEETLAILDTAHGEYMESVRLLKTLPNSHRDVMMHLWEVCAMLSHMVSVILNALPVGPKKEFPEKLVKRLQNSFDSIYCLCEQQGGLAELKSRHTVLGMTLLSEVNMWKLMIQHKHISLAKVTESEDKVSAMLDKAWREFSKGDNHAQRLQAVKEQADWLLIKIKNCSGAQKVDSFRQLFQRLGGCGECLGKCAKLDDRERSEAGGTLCQILTHASTSTMMLIREVKAQSSDCVGPRLPPSSEQQLRDFCRRLMELNQKLKSDCGAKVFQEAKQLLRDFDGFKEFLRS